MFQTGLSVFVVCFFLLGTSACWHDGYSGHYLYGRARHYNGNNQKYYRSQAARPDPAPKPEWRRPVKPKASTFEVAVKTG